MDNQKISDFRNRHAGQRAFVIGKGPSLDTVEEIREQLSTGIIFCLNESVHKIESLSLDAPTYVVQQDYLGTDCVPTNPKTVHFMSSWQPLAMQPLEARRHRYVEVSPWNPNAVLYRPNFFKGESSGSLSAIIALKIAAFMGIKKVTLCCFDALANGLQGPATYANCIGQEKQREGSHRSHNAVILITAREIMDDIKTLKPTVAMFHK